MAAPLHDAAAMEVRLVAGLVSLCVLVLAHGHRARDVSLRNVLCGGPRMRVAPDRVKPASLLDRALGCERARAMQSCGVMPDSPIPSADSAHDLHALLAVGDQACAQARPDVLVAVIRLLAVCVDEPTHVELAAVARLAETDPAAAAAGWRDVTTTLRHRLFDEAPIPWRS